MPQQIGDTLREARMRQKIDITEIEAKTKIRAKYLRAMENEEFDLLPGSTFAKSFLRTYADALGLDSHRLVEEYRAQYEPRDEGDRIVLPVGEVGHGPRLPVRRRDEEHGDEDQRCDRDVDDLLVHAPASRRFARWETRSSPATSRKLATMLDPP